MKAIFLYIVLLWGIGSINLHAQSIVKETEMEIPTYPFSDPDPIPMLYGQPELYPYFKFSTYTNSSQLKKWKVIVLENDYLKVEILPEVGGKIWGITEKKTGYDIIYKNSTLKFRNIATRGPWSSGGIEFNFGFFGHTPYASTPVNYKLESMKNGDAVCWLGASDLPSNSDWRVRIILPSDKAYVKIEYNWINRSPNIHAYYYWTNAAVRATKDLCFFYAGTHQIGHGGDSHLFPRDEEGRDLSVYGNNAFGANKSYHIVGDNKPFKAVYWKDRNVGVGSLAERYDILGKKLWIWSLAPAGAIWEDLLTDDSGQYVEIQSGRLYNQASVESGMLTSFTQSSFLPYQHDSWCEYWYPVINIGGVSEASPKAVLHVEKLDANNVAVKFMALEKLIGNVSLCSGDKNVFKKDFVLSPLQHTEYVVSIKENLPFSISIPEADIYYASNSDEFNTERPLSIGAKYTKDTLEMKMAQAEEHFKFRHLIRAEEYYKEYLQIHPYSLLALTRMGDICLRTDRLFDSLEYLQRALQVDTYYAYANYIYGLCCNQLGKVAAAEEAFAIASRSLEWKVPALLETVALYIRQGKWLQAEECCKEALNYDGKNINTLQLWAVIAKQRGDNEQYHSILDKILSIDALNIFAWLENTEGKNIPQGLKHSEFASEQWLDLAVFYHSVGLVEKSLQCLKMESDNPINLYWLAYLDKKNSQFYLDRASELDIQYVFPHRLETFYVLKELKTLVDSWKVLYYLSLYYWKWGQMDKAKEYMELCGEPMGSPYFYSIRGSLYRVCGLPERALTEYRKHLDIEKYDWRIYHNMASLMTGKEDLTILKLLKQGIKNCPNQFVLEYDYANLLCLMGKYDEALIVLRDMQVLPAEHTGTAYPVYYAANMLQAVSLIEKGQLMKALSFIDAAKKWPSNLGGGFGYVQDFRLQNLLEKYCTGSEVNCLIEEYVEEELKKQNLNLHLRAWLQAYLSNNQIEMERASFFLKKECDEQGTVSNAYVIMRVLRQVL